MRYPGLIRNFRNSVFPCLTINLGPTTCTFDHMDPGNLPFGWCSVTALGPFNPTLGGHLVLWDLQLVIEFPPGSTILLPSATLRHSNVGICEGECRYSVTQFAAGGLFRWVDQGFQPSTVYYNGLSAEAKAGISDAGKRHWELGVGLFSKLEALQQ